MCNLILCRFLCALQLVTGTSGRYQNPVTCFNGQPNLPGTISRGMEAWFLFYGDSDPVQFRVAIGPNTDFTSSNAEFWEIGSYGWEIHYKADYPNTETNAENPRQDEKSADNVRLPARGSYFWVGFVFTGDKECEFYANDAKLGSLSTYVDNTKANQMALYCAFNVNRSRLMEMHFTCPAGTTRNFFPIGNWLCVRPAICFSPGGCVRVKGEYEQTDGRHKKIQFSFDDGTTSHYECDPGTNEFTFSAQGDGLIILADGKWKRVSKFKEGWKSIAVRVDRNFRVEYLAVSTGANKWDNV